MSRQLHEIRSDHVLAYPFKVDEARQAFITWLRFLSLLFLDLRQGGFKTAAVGGSALFAERRKRRAAKGPCECMSGCVLGVGCCMWMKIKCMLCS